MTTETFDFHVAQLEYVKVAMVKITDPLFRPDAKTVALVTTLLGDAETAQTAILAKLTELNIARGDMEMAHGPAHDGCVAAYACMKSCYRNDQKVLPAIRRVVKSDQTVRETLSRLKQLAQVWSKLPSVPGTTDPFMVGNLTYLGFVDLRDVLKTKVTAYNTANADFQSQLDAFREFDGEIASFVTAALVQGRSIYKPGTPQRGYIDAIPTEPSSQPPAQALITLAESPDAGEVHLEFTAEHATSFQVWHKGPSDPAFVLVAEALLPGKYDTAGLAAGAQEYQIVGVNSRGEGAASVPGTVNVAAVAVA